MQVINSFTGNFNGTCSQKPEKKAS